jgi:hypothetical protein
MYITERTSTVHNIKNEEVTLAQVKIAQVVIQLKIPFSIQTVTAKIWENKFGHFSVLFWPVLVSFTLTCSVAWSP